MKAWVDFMKQRAGKKNLWLGDEHFGDWLDFSSNKTAFLKGNTDRDLIANAYFYYSTTLLAKIAGIIGKIEDAENYKILSENVKNAFQQEFVTANGRMISQTQTAYSLALAFGLLPENLIDRVGSLLAADVRQMGHLTTGFVGTPLLCSTLSAIGRDSLAFKLVTRKAYPSWLYPVTQGATTIWERWDGQKPDSTFQSVSMNSFNHYAYGAIGEWLYTRVAGLNIDPENPGYKHIIFSPHVGGGFTNAKAEFLSMYGMIKAAWEIKNKTFGYHITIPANTTATVILQTSDIEKIKINALPIASEVVKNITKTATTLELGSGSYELSYPIK
jgi:alpha-L-rhamnosidase